MAPAEKPLWVTYEEKIYLVESNFQNPNLARKGLTKMMIKIATMLQIRLKISSYVRLVTEGFLTSEGHLNSQCRRSFDSIVNRFG